MKEDILNALCGDEQKYNLIMQRTQQRDIAHLRWEIWYILIAKGHPQYKIALYFNVTPPSVAHGFKRQLEIQEFEERRSKFIKF